ncbi:unnamed protein product, partial [Timema podura]|nr:unnamed protein product [Timema podura]
MLKCMIKIIDLFARRLDVSRYLAALSAWELILILRHHILLKMIGVYEFLPNSEFLTLVGGLFCDDDDITQQLCDNVLFLLCGYDQDQLNTTALPVLLGHIPAGASTNQMIHYSQGVNSAKFRQFSYGLIKNLATYGSLTPPDYDLSKITAPVFLHWSDNDLMADPKVSNYVK